MKALVAVVLILLLLGGGSSAAYSWYQSQINTPASTSSSPVVLSVQNDETATDITDDLYKKGLLKDRNVFLLYLKLTGIGQRFEAGDFVLNKNMSMVQLADALQHGKPGQVAVTIPDGYTAKENAQFVADAGIGSAQEYLAAAADPSLASQYDFLPGKPTNTEVPLEGYLYPDTYSLDKGATPKALVKAQLDEFGQVFTLAWRQEIAKPTDVRPAETIEHIVILASIVEREARTAGNRAKACGVFYNRMAQGLPIGSDVTLLYALGRWKPDLSNDEAASSNPYNTLNHTGYPPGPVDNPGSAALQACIEPVKSDAIHFFVDPNGVMHYETTDDQFYSDIQKYGLSQP